jgi:hypothetical protein
MSRFTSRTDLLSSCSPINITVMLTTMGRILIVLVYFYKSNFILLLPNIYKCETQTDPPAHRLGPGAEREPLCRGLPSKRVDGGHVTFQKEKYLKRKWTA